MLHKNIAEFGKDNSIQAKSRLGVKLFIVYSVIYAGFVFIGTFYPQMLGLQVLSGLNLAFIYGMGLIVLAGVMGLIYNFLCTRLENKMNKETEI